MVTSVLRSGSGRGRGQTSDRPVVEVEVVRRADDAETLAAFVVEFDQNGPDVTIRGKAQQEACLGLLESFFDYFRPRVDVHYDDRGPRAATTSTHHLRDDMSVTDSRDCRSRDRRPVHIEGGLIAGKSRPGPPAAT